MGGLVPMRLTRDYKKELKAFPSRVKRVVFWKGSRGQEEQEVVAMF